MTGGRFSHWLLGSAPTETLIGCRPVLRRGAVSAPRKKAAVLVGVCAVASLIGAGGVLGAGGNLVVTGPGKTVPANATYTITVSGTAVRAATWLWVFQGALGTGASAKCRATAKQEVAADSLGVTGYPVSGHFKKKIQYPNRSSGPKLFCAFLAARSGSPTYAHASATWTNK